MGIDKPNIRTIIHFGPPYSMEAYLQQAGRAGRDGQPAECRMFWTLSDMLRMDQVGGTPASSLPTSDRDGG